VAKERECVLAAYWANAALLASWYALGSANAAVALAKGHLADCKLEVGKAAAYVAIALHNLWIAENE